MSSIAKKGTKFCGVEKCCGKDKLNGLLAVHVENATDYLLRKGEMYAECNTSNSPYKKSTSNIKLFLYTLFFLVINRFFYKQIIPKQIDPFKKILYYLSVAKKKKNRKACKHRFFSHIPRYEGVK